MKRKYAVMTIALIMALNPVSIYASGDSTADTDAVFDDVSDSEEDYGTDENESFNTYVIGQVTDITDTTLEIKVGCLTDTTEDISEYTDMSGAEAADEDTADEDRQMRIQQVKLIQVKILWILLLIRYPVTLV